MGLFWFCLLQVRNGGLTGIVELQNYIPQRRCTRFRLPDLADDQRPLNAPEVRYRFEQDRMYHLQGNQVIDLWLLRGGQWISAPILDVQYVFTGSELRRFVNGNLQQAWIMTRTRETQQTMLALQADADEIAAARAVHTSNN